MEGPLGGRDRRRGSGRFRGRVILNRWPKRARRLRSTSRRP